MGRDLKRSFKENPPKNIIVRMPNWLGDMIMATPILRDLKKQWPEATLTAMCQAPLAVLLEHDPYVDEVFVFHRVSGWVRRQENGDIIEKLRNGHYDLGILLTNSFSSAWWFWRGSVGTRVGYGSFGRSLLLNQAIGYPANLDKMHQVVFYKRILRELGIPITKTRPLIHVTKGEVSIAKEKLDSLGITDHHIVIGVNPAAAFGPAKQWPAERFRAVIGVLLKDPLVRVVVFGDKKGAQIVEEVCGELSERVVNLAEKTSLREFAALVKCCHVFLSNDSGPMHLAAALRIPLVAIFGSTSPTRTRPYDWGEVIYKNVSCSPCYKRECPIDFRCMLRIEVAEVVDVMQKLIKKSYRTGG
jgi:heptosyltransferase-2